MKIPTVSELFEIILIKYRWVFVVLFLLPISILYTLYEAISQRLSLHIKGSQKIHDSLVKDIQAQIHLRNKTEPQRKMCTGRPGWKAMSFRAGKYKETFWKIDLGKLVNIFAIDTDKNLIWVEPLVTMKQLTTALNPLHLTIPIVPELDDLTVSGLIMGMGVETQSHCYGLFQHCCVAYDVLLPTGELVRCSANENPDLYYAIPGSYGTLGFVVAVAIRLIPAKKYVKLRYIPFKQISNLDRLGNEMLKLATESGHDFIEAIVYSLDNVVLITGTMTDEYVLEKMNSIGYFWKPWFYKHVEEILQSNEIKEEYIPLQHYYHRHSRSIFWELSEIVPFGNHPLFRYFFGWTLPIKISLLKRTQGKTIKKLYEKHHVLQDMIVPLSALKDSLVFFDAKTGIYPIWLCPIRLPSLPGMLRLQSGKEEMYVDIGVYGNVRVTSYQAKKTTRELECFVREHHGFQMLYADCYMTREEFGKMFDHELYEKMRRRYTCEEAFPEVYEKINICART
jgi:delta24-sterol reductase